METNDKPRQQKEQEKKRTLISALCTLLFMGLVVTICAFVALYPPDPPIPEEGVEVNLGNSDYGLGDVDNPDNSENMRPTPPARSDGEHISTQKAPSVGMKTSPNNTAANNSRNTTPSQTQEQQPQPQTNQNALFPGKRNNTNGGSQGVTQGTGNQGKEGGDPNSNRYDGQPGHGGSGYSLNGRKASALPTPSYDKQKEGKIIVKIWVDRNGNVTKVEAPQKGSTITDGAMLRQAEAAARKAKFNANPNAAEQQVGTITYVFRRNN